MRSLLRSCVDRRPANFTRIEAQLAAEGPLADGGFLIAYEWHAYLSPTSTACNGQTATARPDWHALAAEEYRSYRRYIG